VSLGTVHNLKQDFYRQCFKAFAELPCHVVMSVGKDTDIAALGPIPVNFTVRNRVPQLEVLKRTRVFVSHGGMNSINESLYFGVPLVMVPQQVEQGFNARRVEKLGAGRLLKSEKITVDSLREAVSQVLQDERYRQNAAQLGQQMQGLGGYARAVDEILRFVHGDVQPALRKTA
jgi:MGT family glycosyltransferase